MKQRVFSMFAAILASICLTSVLEASEAYWADFCSSPNDVEIIFVGRLESTLHAQYERGTGTEMGGSEVIKIFDCGTVRVDSVLWGDAQTDSVLVTWYSGSRLEPAIEGRGVSSPNEKSIPENEPRIWILWPDEAHESEAGDRYHFFQVLEMSWLGRVNDDVGKILGRE